MHDRTQSLLNRTFSVGVATLKFLNSLPYNAIYRIPINQLARSVVSIGANYEEAQGASSKRDFIFKISISQREARESEYWIRILVELYPEDKYATVLLNFKEELNQLKAIFSKIKISASK